GASSHMRAAPSQLEQSPGEGMRFERLLADLSARFVNLPPSEVDQEIEHSLMNKGGRPTAGRACHRLLPVPIANGQPTSSRGCAFWGSCSPMPWPGGTNGSVSSRRWLKCGS